MTSEGVAMSDEKRSRLAAIMFTDIVGYSSMMEHDENNAMRIIEAHNSILLPLIEGFDGRTVDAIGDGLLVVFDSVFSACNCALNIQSAVSSHNSGADGILNFLLRISIHMGDIWQEAGRIYGNGVNIAARLLPLSEPGGICVSDDIHRQLKNKTDAQFKHIGTKTLKNIQQPVVCYQLMTGHERPEAHTTDTDIVKEKLTGALDKLRAKNLPGMPAPAVSGLEHRLERRISGFVENVIDNAIGKWESVPQEKRSELVGNIKKEKWYSDAHLTINLDKSKKDKESDEDDESGESKSDWRELIPVGIVATGGFGAALIWFNVLWLVFPLIFVGLMPLGIGISRLLSRRKKIKSERARMPAQQERLVFEAARRGGGRLSVMQMSAESSLSLDEAQNVLDEMAKRGYIGQEVDDNGLITYVFPELRGTVEDSRES
jgi:class 3 adenylate cyclase